MCSQSAYSLSVLLSNMKYIKKAIFWTVSVAFVSSILTFAFSSSNVIAQVNPTIDTTPVKIEALKQEVVTSIEGCETPNMTADDAPIILDTNNQMSIGPLMFQIKTIQEYEQKIYGKTVTRKDAVEIALDATQSAQLAEDIIFKEGGINNWYNCNQKLALSPKIAVIEELEK